MKYIVFNDERPENFEINNIPYINKANVQISQSKQIVGGSFHDFIPNKYPPDIEFAKNHGKANRVAKSCEKNDLCECCGYPIDNDLLPLCCDRIDLAEFGTGYPLYFEFVFYCIIMLSLMLLVLGVYAMISNYMMGDCDNPEAFCTLNFVNSISIPNKILHPNSYYIQTWVNFAAIVIIMISLHYFRKMQKLTERECDRGLISPSDYAIWIKNLPKGEYTKEDIKNLIIGRFGTQVKIEKIVLAYNIFDFMRLCTESTNLEQKIRKGKEYESLKGKWPEGSTLQELEGEKAIVDGNIEIFIKKTENEAQELLQETSGDVFVIFSEQKDRALIEESTNTQSKLRDLICGCCSSENDDKNLFFKNKKLLFQRAPEPNDILWEDLGFSDIYKFKKRVYTNFMTGVVLFICFLIILGISFFQAEISEHYKSSEDTMIQYAVKSLGYIASFLIVFINTCLLLTIRKFAKMECHSTITRNNVSVAEKLSFAQFCNTAIITFLANYLIYSVENIFTDGGLTTDLYSIFLSNSFIPILMIYFNPWYGWRLYKRWKIEKALREGKPCFVTQKEANQIYEGGPLDMSYKYGILVKTMWFASFYSSIMPLGIVFSLMNVTFTYFLDKYLILRRYARTPLLSADLNRAMIESLEYCPFFMCLGSIFFHILLYDPKIDDLIADIIALGLTSINFIFPTAKLNDILFKGEDLADDPTPYKSARKNFVTDYERANPVTQKEALEDFVKLVEFGNSSVKFSLVKNPLLNYGIGVNTVQKILANNVQGQKSVTMTNSFNQNPVPALLAESIKRVIRLDESQSNNYQPQNKSNADTFWDNRKIVVSYKENY